MIVIIFITQKSDLLCDKGYNPVDAKRCLLRIAQITQNEASCRLSAGQQESTEPELAVRLAYEEILGGLCVTVKSEGTNDILNVSCQSLIFILFFTRFS